MPMPSNTLHTLAQQLAQIAHRIRDAITTILARDKPPGSQHRQFALFQETLPSTIPPETYADIYAQTIVYSLFAARIVSRHADTTSTNTPIGTRFSRLEAPRVLPATTPLLYAILHHIADHTLDTHIATLVDECAHLLAHTDITQIQRNSNPTTYEHDAIVHFYEHFLTAYNPTLRAMRGVYYTPEPVVDYIVHSIDHVLHTQFGKPSGLADGNTHILDPATGTATFLLAVVQHIYAIHPKSTGNSNDWNTYVRNNLLPRLHGFEVLITPHTIAHLSLSLLLRHLGYDFDNGNNTEHIHISLTNALENHPKDYAPLHENAPIVILGNPPYAYESANTGHWISTLVQDYYHLHGQTLGERNPRGLQDDYVKFIRAAQWHITCAGSGILAYISNNGYLDNPTFRGMRASLLHDFDTISILNLHGNSKKKERTPDGTPDENVFDIQQGVTIGIFVKQSNSPEPATVYYADLWGRRAEKYAYLAEHTIHTTCWQPITPAPPWYLFVPHDTTRLAEYQQGIKVIDIFPLHNAGIITGRDALTIQPQSAAIWNIITTLAPLRPEEARTVFALPADTRDWSVAKAQADVRASGPNQRNLVRITYRPFDTRWTYYTGQERGFHSRPRHAIMRHMVGHENLGLITVRQVAEGVFTHAFVTDTIVECRITLSNKGYGYLFPLYLYPDDRNNTHPVHAAAGCDYNRCPNLSAAFISDIEHRLKLCFISDGAGDLTTTVGTEDIFHSIYAMVHCPSYRTHYAEFLKIDFPRIPLSKDKNLFTKLVAMGATLVDLHLLRLPGSSGIGGAGGAAVLVNPSEQGIMQQGIPTAPVTRVRYDEKQGRVLIGADQERYFAGIEPTTWAMQIGGYQPLRKWLKDRIGHTLTHDDALYYMRVVVALRETRRVMGEIEKVVAYA